MIKKVWKIFLCLVIIYIVFWGIKEKRLNDVYICLAICLLTIFLNRVSKGSKLTAFLLSIYTIYIGVFQYLYEYSKANDVARFYAPASLLTNNKIRLVYSGLIICLLVSYIISFLIYRVTNINFVHMKFDIKGISLKGRRNPMIYCILYGVLQVFLYLYIGYGSTNVAKFNYGIVIYALRGLAYYISLLCLSFSSRIEKQGIRIIYMFGCSILLCIGDIMIGSRGAAIEAFLRIFIASGIVYNLNKKALFYSIPVLILFVYVQTNLANFNRGMEKVVWLQFLVNRITGYMDGMCAINLKLQGRFNVDFFDFIFRIVTNSHKTILSQYTDALGFNISMHGSAMPGFCSMYIYGGICAVFIWGLFIAFMFQIMERIIRKSDNQFTVFMASVVYFHFFITIMMEGDVDRLLQLIAPLIVFIVIHSIFNVKYEIEVKGE